MLTGISIAVTVTTLGLANSTQTSASPPLTCRSGKTLFHRGPIRAFLVARTYVDSSDPTLRSPYQTFYVCRLGARRPRAIFLGDPFTRATAYGFRLFGDRLGFVIHSEGFSNGSDTWVGWLDLRIGRLRTGLINAGENAAPGDPTVIDNLVTFAIAGDGTVAIMGNDDATPHHQQEVDLLPAKTMALGPPQQLFTTSQGGLDPRSIGITGTTVTWATTTGRPESAPR